MNTVLDLEQIKKILPHRAPFLLVDAITHLDENSVKGYKHITEDEFWIPGHFPNNPVMPGVLIIEAMAQVGGILALTFVEDPLFYNTYFLKVDKAKFKKMVKPNDTLMMHLELLSPVRRGIVEMKAAAYVNEELVCEAELMAKLDKRTEKRII